MSSLRYLAPNGITVIGMLCGLVSLASAASGEWAEAGYYIIWAVLLDNLDGPVARALKATSEFGAEMDSFADFLNFGVAPAMLVYLSLHDVEVLGFADTGGSILLSVACFGWVVANMVRLARFNVAPETKGVLFGIPTTLAAGVLVIWYLALLKYSPASGPVSPGDFFTEGHSFERGSLPVRAWSYLPAGMIAGAVLMVSSLPNPKIGGLKNRAALGVVLLGVAAGYVFNILRVYPEWILVLPTGWLIFFVIWSQVSPKARGLKPTPIFPERHRG